jgi:hypothetical protein
MLSSWTCLALALSISAATEPRVIERVLAVVDGRPVLLSEARLAQQVRGEDAGPALEALIDEHLMFAEALRLPQAALTDAEEARALASLSARVPGAGVGDPDALRRMARRQATILKYVDFRFRPQVRIAAEDPGEKARLEAEELDARIEAWVKDLRAAAEVRYNALNRTGPASR